MNNDDLRAENEVQRMKILIACETSGVMRRAFAERGHDVWSCDLLPADDCSKRHVVADVTGMLQDGWDMMIAHPPCTRLCRSGRQWMSGPGKWTQPKRLPKGRKLSDLLAEFEEGVALFTACWRAPIAKVAVENPRMNDLALARMPADLPAPQIVQPFWFGEPAYKATGFYLRGLPRLVETNRLPEPERGSDEWKAWNAVHRASPGPDRWKIRSRTFEGVADACADQWGVIETQSTVTEE